MEGFPDEGLFHLEPKGRIGRIFMAERTAYAKALTKEECGLSEGIDIQKAGRKLGIVRYHCLHWLSCENIMIRLESNALAFSWTI